MINKRKDAFMTLKEQVSDYQEEPSLYLQKLDQIHISLSNFLKARNQKGIKLKVQKSQSPSSSGIGLALTYEPTWKEI